MARKEKDSELFDYDCSICGVHLIGTSLPEEKICINCIDKFAQMKPLIEKVAMDLIKEKLQIYIYKRMGCIEVELQFDKEIIDRDRIDL